MLDASSHSPAPSGVSLDLRKTAPWIIFIIFFGVLNETVFNVSTPSIAAQYHLTPSGVSWVVTIFIIFFGIGSVIYGKLSDVYSLKKLIVIGIIVYNVGSILGIICQAWYPAVIAARAIQGAGASAIPALIMVVVAKYFSPADRGKVFGILNSTVAFAIGIGPVLGGFISAAYHWSFLFLIPLFTLISIPFFRKVLPDDELRGGKVDIPGAAMIGLSIASLVLFCTNPTWYYFVIGAALLIGFIVHIRKVDQPFIEPSLLANRLFRSGLIVGFILNCTVMSIMFVMPLLLSDLKGLNTSAIGWILFPGAISAVVFGPIGGGLADKRGNNIVIAIGVTLLACSLIMLSSLLGMNVWFISGAMVFTYIGFSFIQTALANSVSLTLNMEQTGVGMGLFNLVGFISGAVGAAAVARVLDKKLMNFPVNPLMHEVGGYLYSNLLLVCTVAVAIGGTLFFRSYGRMKFKTQ
ncbi:MFS transporter, DHA2 family, metal-tetracycline-proton antiporter [Paenibacillus sp. 1_12]|uniref:MFS transporter n=1 Tax=Paenibacillus sp. 1_12 TaxID=1566278 RepID=UPI0008E4B13D|nr:MFS transporter [Paenibacillus sp. 1_12]SFL65303.1 MFS transporter, DHA2 family, metal-tetracycline-proton antiporter [Paenibacillus sp. 1_12]